MNDRAYRDGRSIGNSRDRRAAAKRTRHGKTVLRQDWPDNEFAMLERLAAAGVTVPFPVARTADGVLMQYIGDRAMAAPRLVHAGLPRVHAERAAALLVENLQRMAEAGVVHADLSVYNLLWWEDGLWIIDVPQAVDITTNSQAFDFLHRDLTNVAGWFRARGVAFDPEQLFGELVATALGSNEMGPTWDAGLNRRAEARRARTCPPRAGYRQRSHRRAPRRGLASRRARSLGWGRLRPLHRHGARAAARASTVSTSMWTTEAWECLAAFVSVSETT